MGDRTAIPPYDYDHMRVVAHDMPPIVRASWFRGVSALPNTFAHESYIDEAATEAGVDPIEYRLRYLKDQRAVDLVNAVAERAGWTPRPVREEKDGEVVHGRGFAYALYVHSKFPGYGAAWSAWVADVAVNKATGDVSVTRVVAGQDSGLMINPDGVRHQIHGNVIQSTSRALMEEVSFERGAVAAREWGAYPIIPFPDVPKIDVLMLPRQDQPPLGVGESASVPSAAAIANAIFDATGVRFREPPFTPERILKGLHGDTPATPQALPAPRRRRRPASGKTRSQSAPASSRPLQLSALLQSASARRCCRAARLHPSRAPTRRSIPRRRSRAESSSRRSAIARSATPRPAARSTPAAARLKRRSARSTRPTSRPTSRPASAPGPIQPSNAPCVTDCIATDGSSIRPFPTHFAKTSDADMQALYAYLMAQPAVRATPPANALAFPFNLRPLLAGWNALFHESREFKPDPAKSELWNRGAYLVEGLGHCSGCHSPRNALGVEQRNAYLAGGFAEGWEAPALTSISHAPIPWNEDELYAYLRTGHSRYHGVAAGPMAPIVRDLKALPDQDIRAMAVYLNSFNDAATDRQAEEALAAKLESATQVTVASSTGARLYLGACAVCHEVGGLPLFGSRPSLALNSNLHSATADNLVQVILHGIAEPVTSDLGYMPAFRNSMSDAQVEELVTFLRRQFAPDKPAWTNLRETIARVRSFNP